MSQASETATTPPRHWTIPRGCATLFIMDEIPDILADIQSSPEDLRTIDERVGDLRLAGHGRLEIARQVSLPVEEVDQILSAWEKAQQDALAGDTIRAVRLTA